MLEDRRIQAGVSDDGPEGHGVERLPFCRLHVPEEIEQDDATRREAKAHRHIEHGPLAGGDARFGKGLHVVGDGLDAGVGAPAE